MKKRKIFVTIMTLLVVGTLAACGGGKSTGKSSGTVDTKEDKGMEILGENVTFDPNKLVNDGETIDIEYWTWNEGDPAITMAKEYEKIYPNVKIKVVNHPWEDYWTKLPLALKEKMDQQFLTSIILKMTF